MNKTIKALLAVTTATIILVVFTSIVFIKSGAYQKMELEYQREADQARITDMHYLARLVEQYKAETGYYPLQQDAVERGAVIYLQIDDKSAADFAAQLSQGLGEEVCVPHDPQRIMTSVPNWYIYEVGPDDYFVTAHLHNERADTRRMGNNHGDPAPESLRNGYYYQIGSKEIPELMVTKFSEGLENIVRPDTLPNGCPNKT